MTDRPIMFSAPMVKALLAGRKTQTRRKANSPLRLCQPGDRLWVRESWVKHLGVPQMLGYRADGAQATEHWQANASSIHMPRWASRLTLTVTDVRHMALEDITEADAEAEGFTAGQLHRGWEPKDIGGGITAESLGVWASAAGHFLALWSKLHPDWNSYSPDPVPVIALTFTVAHRNIDAMEAGHAP